tara:strand:+ start:337 stop:1311 length:975 start_codon:yes stop_codon:yes gene_type:complete
MASRWVDSGIDWANLDLHKERTSWVIDELYRAFKERKSLFDYYTQKESSVISWDVDASMRDENKLDEIMIELKIWLNSLTNNYARFFDTTVDPNGQATTLGFLNGLPYFDSTALGNLETLVGVSLEQIRNWDVTAQRIDSDLLQMIYLVLAELNEIITIRRPSGFAPPQPTDIWLQSSVTWDEDEANWTDAITAYDSAIGTPNTADFIGELSNSWSASAYRLRHVNIVLSDGDFRDSSNVGILPTDLVIRGYNYTYSQTTATFPVFTYDEFVLVNLVGGELQVQDITHPYAFIESTASIDNQAAQTIMYPVVNINDVDAILYYT